MCFYHSPKAAKMKPGNKFYGCHPIQNHPGEKNSFELVARQVFKQHPEVVSEIKIYFLRTAIRQRSTTKMKNHTFGLVPYFVPPAF